MYYDNLSVHSEKERCLEREKDEYDKEAAEAEEKNKMLED